MNCVPDSAAAQHMETYDERKVSVSELKGRVSNGPAFFRYIVNA